jgi:acetyltransferase-like isoleucine patch superfamily enzyme
MNRVAQRADAAFRFTVTAIVTLAMPAIVKPLLLNCLGHRVHSTARIRASLLWVPVIRMGPGVRIGWLNLVTVRRLVMHREAYFGSLNAVIGQAGVSLAEKAAIGNRNIISAGKPLSRFVMLKLGKRSKITASHRVNLGESVFIGADSVIAGAGTQLWTHGFVHLTGGVDRAEVRGRITVGNNVYIGSHSCLGPGIMIGDDISVGSHSSVATSLLEPGVYVSQPLRYIPCDPEERISRLPELDRPGRIYWHPAGGRPPGDLRVRQIPIHKNAKSHKS